MERACDLERTKGGRCRGTACLRTWLPKHRQALSKEPPLGIDTQGDMDASCRGLHAVMRQELASAERTGVKSIRRENPYQGEAARGSAKAL